MVAKAAEVEGAAAVGLRTGAVGLRTGAAAGAVAFDTGAAAAGAVAFDTGAAAGVSSVVGAAGAAVSSVVGAAGVPAGAAAGVSSVVGAPSVAVKVHVSGQFNASIHLQGNLMVNVSSPYIKSSVKDSIISSASQVPQVELSTTNG